MIVVVNIRNSSYDEYIGRGSLWGNPFIIGKHGTRKEVLERYEKYIKLMPFYKTHLHTLKNKVLGCHCKPLACHGDILKKLVENTPD